MTKLEPKKEEGLRAKVIKTLEWILENGASSDENRIRAAELITQLGYV